MKSEECRVKNAPNVLRGRRAYPAGAIALTLNPSPKREKETFFGIVIPGRRSVVPPTC